MPDSVERHNRRQASTDDLMNLSGNKRRTAYHPAFVYRVFDTNYTSRRIVLAYSVTAIGQHVTIVSWSRSIIHLPIFPKRFLIMTAYATRLTPLPPHFFSNLHDTMTVLHHSGCSGTGPCHHQRPPSSHPSAEGSSTSKISVPNSLPCPMPVRTAVCSTVDLGFDLPDH